MSLFSTPLYMAPEALEGRPTEASDLYGLAATLFCLITGEPPFAADTWQELERQARQGLPEPDIRFRAVPQELERVIRAGLAPDAGNRPVLPEFHGMLRGALNQAEVDGFARRADAQQVKLSMEISRKAGGGWQPVVTTQPRSDPLSRDIRRVPPKPARVCVKTREPLRVEVTADRSGFLVLFNVGPTGNLNLLYPISEFGDSPTLEAGKSLRCDDLLLEGPVGRERMFAVWSSRQLPLGTTELRSLVKGESSPGESNARKSSRDIVRVRQTLERAAPSECRVIVLELDHESMS